MKVIEPQCFNMILNACVGVWSVCLFVAIIVMRRKGGGKFITSPAPFIFWAITNGGSLLVSDRDLRLV